MGGLQILSLALVILHCVNEVHSLINSKYIMASSFNDKTIPLADFCLYPSGEQYVAVEIKALQNAHLNLVTDDGLTSYYYQVVIGGTNNTRAFIRKRSPTDMGHKTQVMLPSALSSTVYRPFWISWKEGQVKVGKGLIPDVNQFLSWSDTNPLNITELSFQGYKDDVHLIAYFPRGNSTTFYYNQSTRATTYHLSLTTGSVVECVIECFNHDLCIGMNYELETRICELTQSPKSLLVTDSIIDYYSLC